MFQHSLESLDTHCSQPVVKARSQTPGAFYRPPFSHAQSSWEATGRYPTTRRAETHSAPSSTSHPHPATPSHSAFSLVSHYIPWRLFLLLS